MRNLNSRICHRKHCRYITDTATQVMPWKLKYYKKCAYCQPPILSSPCKNLIATM